MRAVPRTKLSLPAPLMLAAIAVGFAAADTYVVVMALPDMMGAVGISIDELQRAAPIVSGFLLGYVAMLPMMGRISDLHGRIPVLVLCLAIFSVGSFVTAFSFDLNVMVAGRLLQGLGAGGMVPATLALVADMYPPHQRGVPLGIVSAVQEIGGVIGPLFGAAVLAVSPWGMIFLLNLLGGVVLAVLLHRTRDAVPREADERHHIDLVSLGLLGLAAITFLPLSLRPPQLVTDLTWGELFIPVAGESRWLTPLGLIVIGALVAVVAWSLAAPRLTTHRPLLDVQGWRAAAHAADALGAFLMAVVLGGIVLAFATADPAVHVISPGGWWFLLGSAFALIALVSHLRRTANPLVPLPLLRPTPVWGGFVVSTLIGVALIAALIDIPIFARTTTYPDSQFGAALVLLRLLIALPVGAVVGGRLLRRTGPAQLTAAAMAVVTGGFLAMSRWDSTALDSPWATVALLITGFGFGLALAPVNEAVLRSTSSTHHGLALALVVVARMVGMLVGISILTAIGLHEFAAAQAAFPPLTEVCGSATVCDAWADLVRDAGITQEQTVFLGAAVSAALAGLVALSTLGRRKSAEAVQ